MGNSSNSDSHLEKGEGFRILQVTEDSPFKGKVDQFFDFLIQVIPQQAKKSPTEILDRLSPSPSQDVQKSPLQILSENAGKQIKVKVVSTKYRNSRVIQVNLKEAEGENKELTGLKLRKQRYDQTFDTYYPLTDIQSNSPAKKAGLREGLYLIACLQFSYSTLDAFHEGLYERYFNKDLSNKNINLVLYDIATDETIVREVELKRGWGGKGLLGCEFLQGMLNKFPHNLEEQRRQLKLKDQQRREVDKLKNSLGDCDGASKALIQTLAVQRNKKSKHLKNLRDLLNIEPPNLSFIPKPQEEPKSMSEEDPRRSDSISNSSADLRLNELERRVASLQHTLLAVKEYINKIDIQEEQEIKKQ